MTDFSWIKPNKIHDPFKRDAIVDIRKSFETFWENVDQDMPDGRYKALVQTKMEEALNFAVKSVTHE